MKRRFNVTALNLGEPTMSTKTKSYKRQVNRAQLRQLSQDLVSAENLITAADIVDEFARRRSIKRRGSWYRNLQKLRRAFLSAEPTFSVFTRGNSKLPFWNYSALPEFTCPGAGSCLEWCYSFTAWRYPQAYCRQAQNTLFLQHQRKAIADRFNRLPTMAIVRLYVDGDFSSMSDLQFWFSMLQIRSDVKAYGYSKSLHLFAEWENRGLPWPKNYALNISSGSRFDGMPLLDDIAKLPITRGKFIAVPIYGKYARGFARYSDRNYHKEVRQVSRKLLGEDKVFSCPGNCGSCLPNGMHACGSDKMSLVNIVIGVH